MCYNVRENNKQCVRREQRARTAGINPAGMVKRGKFVAELTPMMQQYMKTKEEYKDCILFYRLGDFYEMFFDDAKIASKELELTLTGKNCGLEERAPMCGIPYHAVEGYLSRLVSKGYKVAICEQMEDPALAKGLVRREVVRIVTPGTNICEQSLDESRNNYIMSIVYVSDRFGISFADVTTGDYFVTEVDSARKLMDEMYKFSPREVVCNEALMMSGIDFQDMKDRLGFTMYSLENWYFDDDLCRTGTSGSFPCKISGRAGRFRFRLRDHSGRGASEVSDRNSEDIAGAPVKADPLLYPETIWLSTVPAAEIWNWWRP